MDEESIALLFDYVLGLSDIFEFDTEKLYSIRSKQNFVPKKLTFKPKIKLISQISSELTSSINLKLEHMRDQQKQQNDAFMYKFHTQDLTMQQLTQQVIDKPSQEDLCNIQLDVRKFQQTCQQDLGQIEGYLNQQLSEFKDSLASHLTLQDFERLFEESVSDYMAKIQGKFASKELTFQSLDSLECRFHHINEQLLELKRFTNSNISELQTQMNFVMSDLTTTVKMHEFQDFVLKSQEFATKVQLEQLNKAVIPKVKELSEVVQQNTQKVEDFRKIIKMTDYELLQKATKMDFMILKKTQDDIDQSLTRLQQKIQENQKQIQHFYVFYEDQKKVLSNELSTNIISRIEEVIKDNVFRNMETFNLKDVAQQIIRINDFLKCKANKTDIIDALKLKSNHKDLADLENKFTSIKQLLKSQLSIQQEFMELFGSDTDNESMNFKKNIIQKLVFDTGSLKRMLKTSNKTEQPQTARHSTSKNKLNTSPKSNGVKLLLRPLLSNTFSVQQAKRNRLNLSMVS